MMTERKWMMIAVFSLLFATATGPATAADPPGDSEAAPASVEGPPSSQDVRYKAKTEIDFGERKVSGVLSGPMGVYSKSLSDQQWNPLIRLRRNFDREIVASVDGVR